MEFTNVLLGQTALPPPIFKDDGADAKVKLEAGVIVLAFIAFCVLGALADVRKRMRNGSDAAIRDQWAAR